MFYPLGSAFYRRFRLHPEFFMMPFIVHPFLGVCKWDQHGDSVGLIVPLIRHGSRTAMIVPPPVFSGLVVGPL